MSAPDQSTLPAPDPVCRLPHTHLPPVAELDETMQFEVDRGRIAEAMMRQVGHAWDLYELWLAMSRRNAWHSPVEFRTQEMARLRVARLNECQYCSNGRNVTRDGVQFVEEELVEAVKRGEVDDERFTPRERAAVHLAGQLFVDPHGYSDEQWDELQQLFTPQEIIELAMSIVQHIGMGKFVAWLGVPSPTVAQTA